MTEEEQKKIFGKNLCKYILLSGKDQKDIAKDLGYAPTTFNTWCVGKIIPSMGKVQKIADYFGIGKTDLLEDKSDNKLSPESAILSAKVAKSPELKELVSIYLALNETGQKKLMDNAHDLSLIYAKGLENKE